MRKLSFIIVISTLYICGCNRSSSCSNGMCSISGAELTESEAKENASTFAYKRLLARQESNAPIQDENMKIFTPQPIEPQSWQVTRKDGKWLLKRYLTRDLWKVVECNLDGKHASDYYKIGPSEP